MGILFSVEKKERKKRMKAAVCACIILLSVLSFQAAAGVHVRAVMSPCDTMNQFLTLWDGHEYDKAIGLFAPTIQGWFPSTGVINASALVTATKAFAQTSNTTLFKVVMSGETETACAMRWYESDIFTDADPNSSAPWYASAEYSVLFHVVNGKITFWAEYVPDGLGVRGLLTRLVSSYPDTGVVTRPPMLDPQKVQDVMKAYGAAWSARDLTKVMSMFAPVVSYSFNGQVYDRGEIESIFKDTIGSTLGIGSSISTSVSADVAVVIANDFAMTAGERSISWAFVFMTLDTDYLISDVTRISM